MIGFMNYILRGEFRHVSTQHQNLAILTSKLPESGKFLPEFLILFLNYQVTQIGTYGETHLFAVGLRLGIKTGVNARLFTTLLQLYPWNLSIFNDLIYVMKEGDVFACDLTNL